MNPEKVVNKKVLISVLNWGMGHVARSIGLIHQLKKQGNQLFIACDENQKTVFNQYFIDVTYINHRGYPFQFNGKGSFTLDLMRSFFELKKRMDYERNETEEFVEKYAIDLVLSDHRYGFISKRTPSVFITHQYNLPLKWWQFGIGYYHKKLLAKFNYCWIMDRENCELAGKLSTSSNDNKVHYIGPYSRFSIYKGQFLNSKKGKVLIASGPEVYAQDLVNSFFNENDSKDFTVVCQESIDVPLGVHKVSGNWINQDSCILSASFIVSRSGYSTIMDLCFLKCDSLLIPTPGQEEQIYLSKINK